MRVWETEVRVWETGGCGKRGGFGRYEEGVGDMGRVWEIEGGW